MSYNNGGRYGARPNPYDDRDNSSGGGYGAQPARGGLPQGPRPGGGGGGGGGGGARYNTSQGSGYGGSMGRDNYGSSNVEMSSLTQNAGSFSSSGDPNAILNECRSIDQGIDQIEQNLNQLRMLQDRSLNEADTAGSSTSRQLDGLSTETMGMYRELTERVRQVKSRRDAQQSRNAGQVGRVDRRLKQAIQQFQQVESAFRKKTQDQMARQYRIVRPDAPESEVRAVVEDPSANGQVFQQAMMQSDRRGQARAVLSAVQDRHAALMKIEQQMIELAQLFQDMDTLVIEQEVQVANIEQKGEEVVENLDKGTQEIGVAVETARATRKKKWWCLGICVAIIAVIVIVVVVVMQVNKGLNGGGNKKRSLDIFAGENPIPEVYAQSKIVIPSVEDAQPQEPAKPLGRFVGGRKTARYVIVEGVTDFAAGPSVPLHAADAKPKEKRFAIGTDYMDENGRPLSGKDRRRRLVAGQQ